MSENNAGLPRLYRDLAWLWPLWEPVAEYGPEVDFFVELISRYSAGPVRTLLDMGCGGGKTDFHLKRHFEVTGLDISEQMLVLAGRLNPECQYIRADMKSARLGRTFDAVLVNDAIAYMTDRRQLGQVFETAWHHLAPGGVMVVTADQTKETFVQNDTAVWTTQTDQADITFIQNTYDPDPADTTCQSLMIFLIRRNGRLTVEQDMHIVGLFDTDTWLELLRGVGFVVHRHSLSLGNRSQPGQYPAFCCVKG